jgi:hypothetical protein
MSATVGGVPWTAANVSFHESSGNFTLSGDNTSNLIAIGFTSVSAPGTYAVSVTPARIITVSGPAASPLASHCCLGGQVSVTGSGVTLNDTGSLAITSFTSTRVTGTFSVTLGPMPGTPATGQLVVANGSFDVGVP